MANWGNHPHLHVALRAIANSQSARLYTRAGGASYRSGMLRALKYVLSTQDICTADFNLRGGIKGSEPVWRRYASKSFPNWATKFFVDAM
jgi:hypothetical protein